MKNTGFLFDLDGVLIDSEREYTKIWSEIDGIYPTGVDNFAIKIKGQTLPEILNSHYAPELHPQIVALLNEKEQKMHYTYLPGASELLDDLKNRGYESVLVTSSNEKKMKHLREELPELEQRFKAIITADQISRSKPDPEGYLKGAAILGLPPESCIVLEDSAQGVRAGRSAGCYVVGLSTTLPAAALKEHTDMIIENFAELDLDKLLEKAKRK